MEYSVTNMFAQKMTENVYVKAFAQGEETEQRELPPVVSVLWLVIIMKNMSKPPCVLSWNRRALPSN